jgi:hypothetical protein
MTKQEPSKLKMMWLSPKKFVFEWASEERKILVIAQEGNDLFFLDNGENGGYSKCDMLCWFCENSIRLGRLGHASTCLLGKYILDVTLCKDFVPGPSFGENKGKDLVRLNIAEKIRPKIEWQHCCECQFFNTENVVKFVGDDERGVVIEDSSARFCEILRRLPEHGYGRICKNFSVSEDPQTRAHYEGQKRWLFDYLAELKDLEKHRKRS